MSDPKESKFPATGVSDPALDLQAEKAAALARLAAGMAHDFNNLLMVILGNAELGLLTAEADSPAKPALEQILSAAQRAADYCKQMMAYAGGLKLALRPTDLASLLDNLRASLQASVLQKTVSQKAVSQKTVLRFQPPERLPAIDADPVQIGHLVEQLVTNAADALPAEGGTITLHVGTLALERHELAAFLPDSHLPPGRYVFLEVADTGGGMDRAVAGRALDPYFTTKNKGHGLGMAIVLGILRGHRGAIRVDSQPGQGTRVRAIFPPSASAAPAAGPTLDPQPEWQGRGRALVIDPDEAACFVAAALLEHFGFDSLLAADVPHAAELLQQHAGQVTVILLAAAMPAAEAGPKLEPLRQLAPMAKILLAGENGAVCKPYTAAQLGSVLRTAFEQG